MSVFSERHLYIRIVSVNFGLSLLDWPEPHVGNIGEDLLAVYFMASRLQFVKV